MFIALDGVPSYEKLHVIEVDNIHKDVFILIIVLPTMLNRAVRVELTLHCHRIAIDRANSHYSCSTHSNLDCTRELKKLIIHF